MAETTPVITYEFIPLLQRNAYLKQEAVVAWVKYRGETVQMVFDKYSWADDINGPYTEMNWQPFGFEAVSG